MEADGLEDNLEQLEMIEDIDFTLNSIGHYLHSNVIMQNSNHLFLHLVREAKGSGNGVASSVLIDLMKSNVRGMFDFMGGIESGADLAPKVCCRAYAPQLCYLVKLLKVTCFQQGVRQNQPKTAIKRYQ